MEKKLKNEFIRRCLQTFNNNGVISGCSMMKEDARPLYNAIKHTYTGWERIGFCTFLMWLRHLKIIQKPVDRTVIIFNKSLLDAIIEDEEYVITPPVSKVMVTQSFAFKPEKKKPTERHSCTICNLGFANEFDLKEHTGTSRHMLKCFLLAKREDNDDEVVAEVVAGAGNAPEIINCFAQQTVLLKIKNTSLKPVVFSKATEMNPKVEIMWADVPKADTPITDTATIKLLVNGKMMRSYDYPIVIGLLKSGVEMSIFKQLYFDCHPPEYDDLHQSAPYVRGNPVVKEIDEVIIPGEYPEFAGGFKPKIKLEAYQLTKDMITVLNSGLKPKKLSPQNRAICDKIVQTLKVPDSENCLTADNYTKMLDLLLFIEEHQMQIDIKKYDESAATLTKPKGHLFELQVPELSEHRPSLIIGDSVYVKEPDSKTVFKAFVHRKNQSSVLLSLSKIFAEKVFLPGKKFNISFGYNRTTIKMEHQAVKLIKSHGSAECFFPAQITSKKQQNINFKWLNTAITGNEEQMRAVRHILCNTSHPAPYLVFGPPGTGKTMTIVEAIFQIWKTQPTKNILVCAPSNNAANVIIERLTSIPTTDMLRYISYSFSYSEIKDDVMRYCNYNRGEYFHPDVKTIMKYRVVITTLTTAGRMYNIGLPPNHFQYVFIDESGHATESETLIAIAGFLTSKTAKFSGQLVLAGDPKQLGPIIHSTLADRYGYGTSMLERLMKTLDLYQKHGGNYNNDVLTKLLNNYRSHEVILRIPNKNFYDGELVVKGCAMSDIALGHPILKNPLFPMMFHTVFGRDEREANSPSFFNVMEIYAVIEYLEKLIGTRMSGKLIQQKDIGVITPYRKQVQKIRKMCQKRNWNDLSIGSVEQFQGQERTIIIISTVRSKPEYVQHDYKFHLGFLKNPKRFNVAITRAKALLIVIGNPDLLQYDELWHEYISTCRDNESTPGGAFNLKTLAELKRDDYHELIVNMKNMGLVDNGNFSRGQL